MATILRAAKEKKYKKTEAKKLLYKHLDKPISAMSSSLYSIYLSHNY